MAERPIPHPRDVCLVPVHHDGHPKVGDFGGHRNPVGAAVQNTGGVDEISGRPAAFDTPGTLEKDVVRLEIPRDNERLQ